MMENEHYYAVIMAGGGGTRLWPLSRHTRPKQMLNLFDERSLFQTAVQRLHGVFPPERIYVVTVKEQANELQAQTPEIPAKNFILEPQPRGTASVIGLAALALKMDDPQAIMAVLTADHYIGDENQFRRVLRIAEMVAAQNYLVTLGIQPAYPATGFGYVQSGDPIGEFNGQKVYRVRTFKEKPNEDQARAMLASGDFSWNSGMFFWKAENILEEIKRQMPELAEGLRAIQANWGIFSQSEALQRVWAGLRPETIDYGVMESARNVVVIPASGLGWSDVGSWDSLFDVIPGDANSNIVMGGKHIGLETRQSLIYVAQEHRLIVTIGIDDLIVVDTGDVLLVCRKDQAQKVRQVVKQLEQEDQDYL